MKTKNNPENPLLLKLFLFSLNGDEQINGINPKLMKDIINNRHLLDETDGIEKFSQKIGPRRWNHLLSLDLTKDIPTCRYQLKIIKLIFEKEIANAKFEALSDPFSNAQTKLKILQDLSHEIGWDI